MKYGGGIAEPTIGSQLKPDNFVDFRFRSANFGEYEQQKLVDDFTSREVNAFVNRNFSNVKPGSRYPRLHRTGIVQYQGTTMEFINLLANFIGGYAIEDYKGAIQFHNMARAKAITPTVTLDSSYGVNNDTVLVGHREKYVKNYAEVQALAITTGNITIQKTRTFNTRDFANALARGRRFDFPGAALGIDFNVVNAVELEQVTPNPNATGLTATVQPGFDQYPKTIGISFTPAAVPGDTGFVDAAWRLTIRGRERSLDVVRDYIHQSDKANQALFGRQVLALGRWFASGDGYSAGVNTIVNFIDALKTPRRYVRAEIPLLHSDRGKLDTILSVENGDVINIGLPNIYGDTDVIKILVLRTRYRKGINQTPTKTIFGLEL